MIESPAPPLKLDRLATFFKAFDLSVRRLQAPAQGDMPALFICTDGDGRAHTLVIATRLAAAPAAARVALGIDFGGPANPLMTALPDALSIALDALPALRDTTSAFVAELEAVQCGHAAALQRLGEVIVLMVLRQAIAGGAVRAGLFAGLAHPALHRALVALHDAPARAWRVDDLAQVAGMSRSQFMAGFRRVLGITPMAYLTRWRLALGHGQLQRGERVKAVAHRVGFGSAAAFSRAYARAYGHAPASARLAHAPAGEPLPGAASAAHAAA